MQQVLILALVLGACSSGSPGTTPTQAEPPPLVVSAEPTAPATPDPGAEKAARRRRLEEDVERVAVERTVGSPGWLAVQSLLKDRLTELGYAVSLEPVGRGMNVIGTKTGTKASDELVILSAHYDHIEGCRGADDNASGVAVVLEAARTFQSRPLDRTLVFAFWDLEESGLEGSAAYAERAEQESRKITQMVSLDGVGFARHEPSSQRMPEGVGTILPEIERQLEGNEYKADFIGAMGDPDSEQFLSLFEKAGRAAGIPAIGVPLSTVARMLLSDAARSDHASFWDAGYPAAVVSDTANFRNPNYHCYHGADDPGTLDYAFLTGVTEAVIAATAGVASTAP